jgi:hypothetical protein
MKWNIIWQVDPNDVASCIERDWFHEIVSSVTIDAELVDYDTRPRLSRALPFSIVCVSCPNQVKVADLIAYLRGAPRPRVLYHMSDEFVQVGEELYQHCDLVIRNGSAHFGVEDDRHFVQLPLGYVSGLRNGSFTWQRASQRKSCFAFLGTMKHERETEMLPAFRTLEGPRALRLFCRGRGVVRRTRSFGEATRYFSNLTAAVYNNSVFVPNPKGNWNPECNRLYDALEWGCIPLIRRYSESEYHRTYHDRLLGNHPIPTFDDWSAAADFARDLLAGKDRLDELQAEIAAWWRAFKLELQAKVAGKLASVCR